MATKQAQAKAKAEKPVRAVKAAAPAASAADATEHNKNALQSRRSVIGVVVSDKMKKTIVVKVERQVRHGLYKKYVFRARRYKAHDEKNDAKVGDWVSLVESRPLSRDKRWVLQSILRKAGQVVDVDV